MNKQKGMGLIEVLIAVLVLAVGLLGFAALQGQAIRLTNEAYWFSEANMLAYEYFDRVRANRLYASGTQSAYTTSIGANPTSSVDCATATCSSAQMAAWDMAQWKAQVRSQLPSGDARTVLTNRTVGGRTVIEVTVTLSFVLQDTTETFTFETVI